MGAFDIPLRVNNSSDEFCPNAFGLSKHDFKSRPWYLWERKGPALQTLSPYKFLKIKEKDHQ